MLRGEFLRALQVARGDGHHFGAEGFVGRSDDAARRDSRSAEDADAYHGGESRMSARRAAHCRRPGCDPFFMTRT
jgi:hypothetical protein